MPSLFPSLRGRARGEAFNKMNRDTALVVFSGGQDSTTCLFWAKREFKKVYALSFCMDRNIRRKWTWRGPLPVRQVWSSK